MDNGQAEATLTDSATADASVAGAGTNVDADAVYARCGVLAEVASHPVIIGGATVAAAFSAASYIALDVAIKPGALSADQRTQYVLFALSGAVTCLVAAVALGLTFLVSGARPRVRLERSILAIAALTYGLQAGSSVAMQGDFHALGTFVPSEVNHVLQWTSALGTVALFATLVVDAALAADARPLSETWWRGAVGAAAVVTLIGAFIKLTVALTNLTFTRSNEVALGVTSVIAGALVAASATRVGWWWRVGVGVGLAISGWGFVELGRVGALVTLNSIAEDSLAIGVGYGVLALTGLALLVQRLSSSRTPRDPARYPD